MPDEQFLALSSRLRSLASQLGPLDLGAFSSSARSRASSLTCAHERHKRCELERLAELADSLAAARDEFRAGVGSPA